MSEPMDTCSSGSTASTSCNTKSFHCIPRKFKKIQVTVNLNKLKQDSKFHVINNVDDFGLGPGKEYIFVAKNLQQVHQWKNWIGSFAEETNSTVHIVISDRNGEGKAFWHTSFGEETNLKAHLVQQVEKVVDEGELIAELENYKGQVVLISGEFGMGKSTTLRRLIGTLESNHPDKDIVQIDLGNNKVKSFGEIFENVTHSKTKDFSKTIVLFDSFEETGLKNQNKIFKIFDELLHKGVHLLLVACQQHCEIDLVKFSSKIFRLEPLSRNEFKIQLAQVENQSGKFYKIISNREDEFQTPLLFATLVQLAENQPNKNGLINSPAIFKAFKGMFEYYIDQYTTKILQINPSRNFSTGELRSQRQRLFYDLGLYNINRLLESELETVLRKSDLKRIRAISKESSTVRNLLTFCSDLDHSTFREFFVAYFLYLMYVDLEDLPIFWQLFETLLKAEDLVNVFFFQMLSTRFEESRSLSTEDHVRFKDLLEFFYKYNEDEQLNFVVGRNLPGCLRILLQNGYTLKIKMVITVLANDFFEIIDYFHRNEILLTMHEWTISQIASDYKFVKTINHLEEKFSNFKVNREKSETTIPIHCTRRKFEELQLTGAVSSQEFLMEDIQRAKRARLRTNQSKTSKNEFQDEEMSGPSHSG